MDSGTANPGRVSYLDNLRVFLTALVILHHTAITYGASGSWYVYERSGILIVNLVLTMFTALNQFFFMGLFFFLAGYFSPVSLDRKGANAFFQDRLLRLGVPLLLFGFFLTPVSETLKRHFENRPGGLQDEFMWTWTHPLEFTPGPLWFVAALLLFSCAYVLCAKTIGKFAQHLPAPPRQLTNRTLVMAAVALAVTSFVVRLWYPVGQTLWHFQVAYFPQYIVLFIAGVFAFRFNWLGQLTKRHLRFWFPIVVAIAVLLPVIGLLGGAFEGNGIEKFNGGRSWQAATIALLENLACIGISVCVLVLFRARVHRQSELARLLSSNAYSAYIIHTPILLALSLALQKAELFVLLKFVIVGASGVLLSFFLSHSFVRRIPFAEKVL